MKTIRIERRGVGTPCQPETFEVFEGARSLGIVHSLAVALTVKEALERGPVRMSNVECRMSNEEEAA